MTKELTLCGIAVESPRTGRVQSESENLGQMQLEEEWTRRMDQPAWWAFWELRVEF